MRRTGASTTFSKFADHGRHERHTTAQPLSTPNLLAFGDTLDIGANALKLVLDTLVAAVNVVDATNIGCTTRNQTSKYQTR